jgi:glutamate-1-semialdehyde aminotransferase
MNKKKLRKEIDQRANELRQSFNDELANIRITADVERLGRLVTLFHYHTTYELMKAYNDAGLQKELTELAKKAGEKQK